MATDQVGEKLPSVWNYLLQKQWGSESDQQQADWFYKQKA